MNATATEATAQMLASVRSCIEGDDRFRSDLTNITEQLVHRPDYMFQAPLVKALSQITNRTYEQVQNVMFVANFPDAYDIYVYLVRLGFTVEDFPEIKKKFNEHEYQPLFEKVTVVPGIKLGGRIFSGLVFSIDPRFLPQQILPSILNQRAHFGENPIMGRRNASSPGSEKKKLIIEFSGPILGPGFQDYHIRGATLGASIANMYKAMGWDVYKINYLQDWGGIGMAMFLIAWVYHGSEEKLSSDPLAHLSSIYASNCSEYRLQQKRRNKAAEKGEDTTTMDAVGRWTMVKDCAIQLYRGERTRWNTLKRIYRHAIEGYKAAYARMNVTFDEYSGHQSQFLSTKTCFRVHQELDERGLYERGQNGKCEINFEKHGFQCLGSEVFVDENGERMGILWTIGDIIDRYEKHAFDKMICVCPIPNARLMRCAFKTLELLGLSYIVSCLELAEFNPICNVIQGLGNQISSPSVMSLNKVMDQSCGLVLGSLRRVSPLYGEPQDLSAVGSAAAAGAVHFQCTHNFAHGQVGFNEKHFTFSRDSGPYIQYMHAYMKSRLPDDGSEEAVSAVLADMTPESLDKHILANPDLVNLLRRLAQFPRAVAAAYQDHDSFELMGCLVTLTRQVDRCIAQGLMGGEGPMSPDPASVALHLAVCQVLENGLKLLNIEPFDLSMIPRTPGHSALPHPDPNGVPSPEETNPLVLRELAGGEPYGILFHALLI